MPSPHPSTQHHPTPTNDAPRTPCPSNHSLLGHWPFNTPLTHNCTMPSSLLGVTSGMAATNTAEKSTTSRPSQRPFSAGGIHRRKHTHRAIFRSVSFLLLLGGYAVYNGLSGDDGGVGPKTTTAAAAHHRRLQFIDDDHFQSLLQTNQTPRTLQDAASTDNSSSPSCPALETTSPPKALP